MQKKFKHFIIVKFDYPEGYPYLHIKKQQLRWCLLDSLRNQTNKEFVLVFNSTIPMPHEGFGEMIISPCWKDKVREAAKDYEYVITTRIDGDDFVTLDFVEKIQNAFEEKDKLILQQDGWTYETRQKKLVKNWMFQSYISNCFSFIEKADNINTCYVEAHGLMNKKYEVKKIHEKIHIWCINEESLRAINLTPEKFTHNFKDEKKKFFELDERHKGLIDAIDVFNNKIKNLKNKLINGRPEINAPVERLLDTNGRDKILNHLKDCKNIADIGYGGYPIREDAIGYDHNLQIDGAIYCDVDEDFIWLKEDLKKRKIDGVCLSHVLEHFPHCKRVLQEIYNGLPLCKASSIGKIAIVVPNGETVPYESLGDSSGTHHVLFTPITLKLFLEHVGFKDVKSEYYERPYAYKQTKGIFACGVKRE